jgi:hypothetical protein
MIICFGEHCYDVVVVEIPVSIRPPGIGPINYPRLMMDATLVASVEAAANKVEDAGVRAALHGGIKVAVQALQKRAGSHVSIKLEGTAGGPPTGGGAHGPGRE